MRYESLGTKQPDSSEAYYETVARPFEWKFTRADLDELLVKLARQEEHPHKAVA